MPKLASHSSFYHASKSDRRVRGRGEHRCAEWKCFEHGEIGAKHRARRDREISSAAETREAIARALPGVERLLEIVFALKRRLLRVFANVRFGVDVELRIAAGEKNERPKSAVCERIVAEPVARAKRERPRHAWHSAAQRGSRAAKRPARANADARLIKDNAFVSDDEARRREPGTHRLVRGDRVADVDVAVVLPKASAALVLLGVDRAHAAGRN